jgi:hypothetical protein
MDVKSRLPKMQFWEIKRTNPGAWDLSLRIVIKIEYLRNFQTGKIYFPSFFKNFTPHPS